VERVGGKDRGQVFEGGARGRKTWGDCIYPLKKKKKGEVWEEAAIKTEYPPRGEIKEVEKTSLG